QSRLQPRVEHGRKRHQGGGGGGERANGRDMEIRCVGSIDVATANALERRVERVIASSASGRQHGGASYQRGERMANDDGGAVCLRACSRRLLIPASCR